jgi:hypothetical protein
MDRTTEEQWFVYGQRQETLFYSKRSCRLRRPPSPLIQLYGSPIPQAPSDRNVKFTDHLHLIPRLFRTGAQFRSPKCLQGINRDDFTLFSTRVDLLMPLLVLCRMNHLLPFQIKWPMKGAGCAGNESDCHLG